MNPLHSVWKILGRMKYLLVIIVIGIIVGFLDENSYFARWERRQRMNDYEEQIAALRKQYATDSTYLHDLETNPHIVERLARERYYMHRDNEDVFVITEEPVVVEENAVAEEEVGAAGETSVQQEGAQSSSEASTEKVQEKNDSTLAE